MQGLTLELNYKGDMHRKIARAVQDRIRMSKQDRQSQHEKWNASERRSQAYMPERDVDRVRRERREGGKPEYTTIQIPYTYAVQLASHTYWTTVFMGRTPVMQFQGRHGETENQVMAMEALMDYQYQVGQHGLPYYIWLFDVGRYGHSIIASEWRKDYGVVSQIEEIPETIAGAVETGKTIRKRTSKRVMKYQGNKLKNIRPHDFFPDPRYPLHRFQEGEFCAILTTIGWNELVKGQEQGRYTNLDYVKRKGSVTNREEGSEVIDLPDTHSLATYSRGEMGSDTVEIYECHIEIIPKEWGLGSSSYPEKWAFTITSDFTCVIGAQPLGYMHDAFPFDVLELEPEAYSVYSRGYAEILEPIQNTLDWLINSHFYNVRKALNNEYVVDPSRVVMKDLLNPLPGGIIRLRPAAYGSDARTAVHQFQTSDVTRAHMSDLTQMMELGQRVSGVNDSVMGMANPSSRRSATEIRSTNTFSVNRLKTTSELFSTQGFQPLAQKMVQNTQQFYDGEQKYRIVGDLAQMAGPQFMNVNQDLITGFYDFVPVDGTLPVDRFAQANLWRELLMTMSKTPQILMQYDIGRIFGWVAQLTGLKNINQFKVQVVPDAMAAQQAQQGNLVPLPGGRGTEGPNGPSRQISGMGDTA